MVAIVFGLDAMEEIEAQKFMIIKMYNIIPNGQ
jgi:hypothetical protein